MLSGGGEGGQVDARLPCLEPVKSITQSYDVSISYNVIVSKDGGRMRRSNCLKDIELG